MVGKVSWNILCCLYSTCLTKSKMHQWQHLFCLFYLKIGFKINCRFHQISENSRSRSPSSESPPISDAQVIPVVRGRGNGRRGRGDRSVRRPRGRTVSRSRGGDRERGDRGKGRGGRRPRQVVYGPTLPTRADLAAAAREERDTQLRVYIVFSHRWKCNVIVCEINKLYIRISPQYVQKMFPLWQKFETRQKKRRKK